MTASSSKGKDAVVFGGGEVAVEEALFLSKLVKSVKLIHRRDRLKAARVLEQKALKNKRISFVWNSVVEEILGDKKVEDVRIKNVSRGEKSEIKCDDVFVAIGHRPNTEVFRNQVELDKNGYVKKYEGSKTSVEGVFVAGDVYDYVYRQAVTAVGSGCEAAIDVIKYLEGRDNDLS